MGSFCKKAEYEGYPEQIIKELQIKTEVRETEYLKSKKETIKKYRKERKTKKTCTLNPSDKFSGYLSPRKSRMIESVE